MEIQRGLRDSLENYIDINKNTDIFLSVSGNAVYNYICFGLDENEKISDNRYIVSAKNTDSPDNEIQYSLSENIGKFSISLNKINKSIKKLAFAVSIEGDGTMNQISECSFTLNQEDNPILTMKLSGNEFRAEKALILIEIYQKNDKWRFSCIARGFYGGLPELMKLYENTPSVSSDVSYSKICITKGIKIPLDKNASDFIRIEKGCSENENMYSLKALVRYRSGSLIYIGCNSDEAVLTPECNVKYIRNTTSEYIDIKWHKDIASIAVCSYSAVSNAPFSCGQSVHIINGKQIIQLLASFADENINSRTLCWGEIIFNDDENSFDISALEIYSKPYSENRIGYQNNCIVMDIGPCTPQTYPALKIV